MLFAARKKPADGEDRLLIKFHPAWIIADMRMRIMAIFVNGAASPLMP